MVTIVHKCDIARGSVVFIPFTFVSILINYSYTINFVGLGTGCMESYGCKSELSLYTISYLFNGILSFTANLCLGMLALM